MITHADLHDLARDARGLTGADVEAVVRRARGRARRAVRALTLGDLRAELVAASGRDAAPAPARTTELLAVHAAARAVVGHALADTAVRSIDLRGGRLHMELAAYDEHGNVVDAEADPSHLDEAAAQRRMVVLLAGRAAEARLLDRRTLLHALGSGPDGTGASDLDHATRIATELELASGSDGVEPIGYGLPAPDLLLRVPGLAGRVAARLARARTEAERVVATFAEPIQSLADRLVHEGRIRATELPAMLDGR